jgi:hypothetical protein
MRAPLQTQPKLRAALFSSVQRKQSLYSRKNMHQSEANPTARFSTLNRPHTRRHQRGPRPLPKRVPIQVRAAKPPVPVTAILPGANHRAIDMHANLAARHASSVTSPRLSMSGESMHTGAERTNQRSRDANPHARRASSQAAVRVSTPITSPRIG